MAQGVETAVIRNETQNDHAAVEQLIRDAFWDVHVPGCTEHYLAHCMRTHPDFVPELDLVLEQNGAIVAQVMYTLARLTDEAGRSKRILTFGPLSVEPALQRRGCGKKLLEYSFSEARRLGYDAIVIFGDPANYVGCGFQSCKRYRVSIGADLFPFALLVLELVPGALSGHSWRYEESSAYAVDTEKAEAFERQFAPRERGYRPSQETFWIQSHALLHA